MNSKYNISVEDLTNKFKDYYTVGDLIEFIFENKIPLNAKICTQRVEDVYFEKNGWGTVKKEGEYYNQNKQWNADIDSGIYLNKEEYPNIKPENLVKVSDEDLEKSKTEYIPVWCPVKYDGDNNLYLDLHY